MARIFDCFLFVSNYICQEFKPIIESHFRNQSPMNPQQPTLIKRLCTPACLFAFIQQSLITVIFPYLHRINVVFMWDRQLNEVDDIPLRAVQTTIYLVLGRSVHSQKGLQKLPTFPPIRCCSWYVGLSCTDLAILQ